MNFFFLFRADDIEMKNLFTLKGLSLCHDPDFRLPGAPGYIQKGKETVILVPVTLVPCVTELHHNRFTPCFPYLCEEVDPLKDQFLLQNSTILLKPYVKIDRLIEGYVQPVEIRLQLKIGNDIGLVSLIGTEEQLPRAWNGFSDRDHDKFPRHKPLHVACTLKR